MTRSRRRITLARAGRLSIRPEWPIGWRVASVAGLVAAIVLIALLAFDAGRQAAGFNEVDARQSFDNLTQTITELRVELSDARKVADASESVVQMERTAQTRLAGIVKGLEEENARLKAELAVFERIAGGAGGKSDIVISRVDIRPENAAGSYRFRMLLARTGTPATKDFNGQLEFLVTARKGKDTVTLRRPESGAKAPIGVSFKQFTRVEGVLDLGAIDAIESVDVRLIDDGVVRASSVFRP